jgi:[ribosomal protein S18]-alanine N-acetyltransferase
VEVSRHTEQPHIRWAITRDLDAILRIENEREGKTWSEQDFVWLLRVRNVIGSVFEIQNNVMGFMIFEFRKDNLRILRLAVAKEFRRRGIGRQLMDKLFRRLFISRRRFISIKVGDDNLGAHKFLAAVGFRAVKVLRRPDTDVYRFLYKPPAEASASGPQEEEAENQRKGP